MDSSDSSDDEREPFEQKYNELGKFVKARLKSDNVKSKVFSTDFKNSHGQSKSWKSVLKQDEKSSYLMDSGEETELNLQSPQNESCLNFYGYAESKTALKRSSELSAYEGDQPEVLEQSSSEIKHQPESFSIGNTGLNCNGVKGKLASLMHGQSLESKEIKLNGNSSSTKIESFESVFGLKIINPLITVGNLKEKMAGRNLIPFHQVKHHVQHGDLSKDWCISGAVVSTGAKVSTKGNNYCVWKVSDLKLGLKTVSLFLFGGSYTALWKTRVGTVIGVLNPSVMDSRKDNADEAMLSVFNCEQIMVCGMSKDFGFCKARKKDGDACKNFINKSHCEFCIYHVQKEYKKFSNSRSNLHSTSNRGPNSLRNKVLGKNEVFYAGKSFTAVKPAKPVKGKNIREKDQKLLTSLFGGTKVDHQSNSPLDNDKSCSSVVDVKFTRFQKIKDAQLLERLSDTNFNSSTVGDSTKLKNKLQNGCVTNLSAKSECAGQVMYSAAEFLSKSFGKNSPLSKDRKGLKDENKSNENINNDVLIREELSAYESVPLKNGDKCKISPKLSNSTMNKSIEKTGLLAGESNIRIGLSNLSNNKFVDVSLPISRRDREAAKLNALMYIKKKGPIEKIDPNAYKNPVNKRKRTAVELNENNSIPGSEDCSLFSESKTSSSSVLSERFIELMNKSSKHVHLLEDADEKLMEEYFLKMSKKEDMEEKMLNTFKIPCKAVRCLKCKYTWFSASEFCKQDQHPIKVVDAMKRFFKCNDCGNRTATFEIIPLLSCKQCGGCNWKRAPLLSEKRTLANLNQLSIRGGEQKFINSDVTNSSLNLLVPD